MKTILLKGESRGELGTRTAKALRSEGKVPCVIYSEGKEATHFAVYQADFKNLVYTPNVYKVRINLDGQNHEAILQDIQFHPVSDAILHADFMTVDANKKVIMEVPIRVVGNSPGVRGGGKLITKITRLRVKGLIADMPDFIDVTIDGLEIGQSAKVRQISIDKLEILDAQENAIVSVKTTRALMQAAAEAGKK